MGAETAGAPVAPAVQGGIVYRRVLFGRLTGASRVTVLSAPAGSGKTFLLRSWIAEAGLVERAAWVAVQGGERDPQRFWVSVADALRLTVPGSALVRGLTAAPDLDGWAVVERLLKDLVSLEDRVWLVIDDVHELRAAEALRQLELLMMRAPPELRFVLAARHDLRLGLHRLRLEGELTEIRAADLRFTAEEARALLEAAGVALPDSALALLHERTEGWAAGLRLAALSLAGHPDPERFAATFSGGERTVAEYLLAEVLDRQPRRVRRFLLRTSVLEQVNGELADALTGRPGGERILQELEQANAFVVAVDERRSWFRYHRLFADLLQLELRRTAPGEVAGLHSTAAGWYAEHGFGVEAIRHAQATQDWGLAARLLSDHWLGLFVDGRVATAHELLARFPSGAVGTDAELAAVAAGDQLGRGSPEEAERTLRLATERSRSVPADRRGHVQAMIAIMRVFLARLRGDLPAVAEEVRRLLEPAGAPAAAQLGAGEELRVVALISLGITEFVTARFDDAERHLEQASVLGHRIGRPFLEFRGLAHWAVVASVRSFAPAAERSLQAVELARRHGWANQSLAGIAYLALGAALVFQGRLEEAEPWLQRAEQTVRAEAEPAVGLLLHHVRAELEVARGCDDEALAALRGAERLARLVVAPSWLATRTRALRLHTLVRMGQTEGAEAALAGLGEQERETGEMRTALAALRLAQDDPHAATVALAPVIDGSAPVTLRVSVIQALLLEGAARDALGDPGAAGRALERALDLAETDGAVLPFLLHPVPGLLERHTSHRTSHASLVSEILGLLAGASRPAPAPGQPPPRREPLTESETRILRYLPTNLSAREIADELYLSWNTVRTHMRHLYAKLGAHRRHEAVEQARALGLLAPSRRRRQDEAPAR
jgi:LuxR family maltose regulon positive regulatory protein